MKTFSYFVLFWIMPLEDLYSKHFAQCRTRKSVTQQRISGKLGKQWRLLSTCTWPCHTEKSTGTFLSKVNNRETKVAIGANNDTYCVQTWMEKFLLWWNFETILISLYRYSVLTSWTFPSGNVFYRKSTMGTSVATIEANSDTYCLQKRIEKVPLRLT